MSDYSKALSYLPEVEPFLEDIAEHKIGRAKLARKLKISDTQARKVIDLVRNIPKDTAQGLLEECELAGIPINSVRHFWYKSKQYSIFAGNEVNPESFEEKFEEIVQRYLNGKLKKFKPNPLQEEKALIVTETDAHVGMNPNPDSEGLYKYEYGAGEYRQAYQKMFDTILEKHRTHGTFEVLYLDNLGDNLDGWNGYTTRGGHKLEQNMNNIEAFTVALETKLELLESIIDERVANKIVMRMVVNDNHAGDFGHILGVSLKKIVNRSYDKELVDVDILSNFIEPRFYGDHGFLLTHGKDKKFMRSGLPLHLNDGAIKKLSEYIDFYKLEQKAKYLHVQKGDLHQLGYNKCHKFDYYNFMSLAPPSAYLQANYGAGYSGYSVQVVPKFRNELSVTHHFINYKKKHQFLSEN